MANLWGFSALSTVAMMIGLSAGVANAASESCKLDLVAAQCWTNPVQANSNSHHVHIDVSPHVTWSVVDKDNGKVVARGTTGWGWTRKTITGLYGRYRLHLQNGVTAVIAGGNGHINNN